MKHCLLRSIAGFLALAASSALAPAQAQSFTSTTISSDASIIWRDFTVNGVPSSGVWNPRKTDLRQWGAAVGGAITQLYGAASTGKGLGYATRAALFADLSPAANSLASVFSDGTSAFNGVYIKSGASGTGSWTQVTTSVYALTPALTVGTVSTLTPGSSATATISGSAAAPVLNLGIPAGLPPALTIGTVTTGAAGSSAAASVTGTQANPVLNFTIPTGAAGPGWNQWRGTWSSATAYVANDIVQSNGSSFIAIANNTNSAPPSANWALVAQRGIDGSGAGTVTSITAAAPLTGGTITSTGTIGIANNGITSALIADNAISNSKIANSAVTYSKIQNVTPGTILGRRSDVAAGPVQELPIAVDTSGNLGIGLPPVAGQGALQSYRGVGGGNPVTSGTSDPNQMAMLSGGAVQLSYGAYANGDIWMQSRLSSNFATNLNLVLQPNGGTTRVGGLFDLAAAGVRFPDGTTQTTAAGGINRQVFDSSGTWTKPASGTIAKISVWAGGASGAKNNTGSGGGGGGGGGYNERWVPIASLGATETVIVGAAGAAVSANATNGITGGNSSFGAWVTAYGGSGGAVDGRGGGGGGQLSSGTVTSAPDGGNTYPGAPVFVSEFGIEGVNYGRYQGGGASGSAPGSAFWHGGGGGVNATGGGASVFGGAGGGGGGGPNAGGASSFGGSGGAGNATASGGAGMIPGGGGGGTKTGATSGAGGAGRVIVEVF
jgi:hypothetical protein